MNYSSRVSSEPTQCTDVGSGRHNPAQAGRGCDDHAAHCGSTHDASPTMPDEGPFAAPAQSVPFPPADVLAQLEAVVPGSNDRILRMAELDQHSLVEVRRIQAEAQLEEAKARTVVAPLAAESIYAAMRRAQWTAFIFLMGLTIGLSYSVYENQSFALGALAVASIGGVVLIMTSTTKRPHQLR